MQLRVALIALLVLASSITFGADSIVTSAPSGWTTAAPREEIKPQFRYDRAAGRNGKDAFVILGDSREGTTGWWQKSFEVEGGKTYRFSAWRKTAEVDSPRVSG